MKHTIYQGDALEVLKKLPEKSVNCVMTSPPYWALRAYSTPPQIWDGDKNCKHDFSIKKKASGNHKFRAGKTTAVRNQLNQDIWKGSPDTNFCTKCNAWRGELGLEPDFELYIKHLCDIFDQVKRVLRDDGTCWVNIGDTYYGSGKGVGTDIAKAKESYIMPKGWDRPSRREHEKAGINKNCLECGKKIKGKPNSQFCSRKWLNKKGNDFRSQNRLLPDKTLVGIPFRFALEMISRGWILRNTIIWHKKNCMPSSAKDRFTIDFEYLFFFSKNNNIEYWVNNKTSELVSKKPLGTKGKEGEDWDWKECTSCKGNGCKSCKQLGKKKRRHKTFSFGRH